ncbi:MAG: hypothetical protein EA353_11085 [Puniceicoccaceae bacterium]|nr:MAG: hypothetical protein EA353_11085 [Puniceicoccaceae bacterium]
MKYPLRFFNLGTAVAVYACLLILPSDADARIGERRDSIERRLFDSGGIVYRDEATRQNRMAGMPYLRFLDYLPSSADVRIYFKTPDGRRPSSSDLNERRMPDGWDLHLIAVDGRSVVEVYRRSQAITEDEFNQLLAIHAESSFWKRLSEEERDKLESAFGVDMIRDDAQVRAKRLGGNTVLFVDSGVDARLADLAASDRQQRAPISVRGF